MIWQYILTGLAIGLTVSAVIDYVAAKIRNLKAGAQSDRLILNLAPPTKNPSSQWHAMPCGKRLELSDTGYYITLNPEDPGKVYQGFTPEHLRLATGSDLAGLKRHIEGEARERAEFEPKSAWWRP